MAVPINQLQTVATYQPAELAYLLNSFVAINISDKRFKDFENKEANLGDTVTFELAYRATTVNGLIASLQETQQRVQSLACVQATSSTYAFTAQQFIFNVKDYMLKIGKSRILEIGTKIETDILKNATSSVTVLDPQNINFGNLVDTASGPYRFFGDGVTPINSFGQLAQACANFRNYGAAKDNCRAILPDVNIPTIVNSGLGQFATDRNNELATSWMLGKFSGFEWYESNLLPIHVAGTVGESAQTLTLTNVNDPTGLNITSLTLSGATPGDPNAIKVGDLLYFIDGVAGQPNMRYLTFIGHVPSSQAVQFRATENVAADISGNVIIPIYPALVSQPTLNQNLNNSLAAGMQVKSIPSHRAGLLMSGNPLYLAMPKLPNEDPFGTVSTTDPESGASIRHYWGSQLGQNSRIYVYDQIWGSTLVAENSMRLVFPL